VVKGPQLPIDWAVKNRGFVVFPTCNMICVRLKPKSGIEPLVVRTMLFCAHVFSELEYPQIGSLFGEGEDRQ
jgi:hypothetical protein